MILFYNPQCSKCRRALELLDEAGAIYRAVNVLEQGLKEDEARHFYTAFGDRLLRAKVLQQAGIEFPKGVEDAVRALQDCPQAMERPIAVIDEKAIIARPPEVLLEYLSGPA